MLRVLIIGGGGFLGAISRYVLSGLVFRIIDDTRFPYGTLAVNLIGSFIIGFLNGLIEMHNILSPETRAFLLIGFIGSFTTFSTFSFETLTLARGSQFWSAGLNVVFHIVFGLIFVWLGYAVSKIV